MPLTTPHSLRDQCKKSECLKKYCECFANLVVCGESCKCSNCKNYVGSQALIERRRKLKDAKGMELAMRPVARGWKGSMSDSKVAYGPGQSPVVHNPRMPHPDNRDPLLSRCFPTSTTKSSIVHLLPPKLGLALPLTRRCGRRSRSRVERESIVICASVRVLTFMENVITRQRGLPITFAEAPYVLMLISRVIQTKLIV